MSKSNMEAAGVPMGSASAGFQRSGSMDGADPHFNQHPNMKSDPPAYARGYTYPPHYPASRHPHPIQSVVTTSFEEREDGSTRHMDHHAGGNFMHPEYGMRHGRSPPDGREEAHRAAFEPPRAAFEPPHHEREPSHHHGRHPPQPPHHGREPSHQLREAPQYGRELPPIQEGDMDIRHTPNDMMRSRGSVRVSVPPSPRGGPDEYPPLIHRSHSAGAPVPPSYRGQEPLKRSFWHHARSGEDYQSSVPNEFVPPKRSKVGPAGRRDYVVTARSHHDEVYPADRQSGGPPPRSPGWFNRAMSWEAAQAAREEYYHREPTSKMYSGPSSSWSRSPQYREGGVGQHWSDAPSMPSPRSPYAPNEGGHYNISPPGRGGSWGHSRWNHPEEHLWGGHQNRDEAESRHMAPEGQEREGYDVEMRRQSTFESSDGEPPMRFIGGPSAGGMEPSQRQIVATRPAGDKQTGPIRLLALPEDRISLSETLCLVREVRKCKIHFLFNHNPICAHQILSTTEH
jgi:hypothetical protein